VVDVSGAYVAPGLVDLHAHAFIAGHDLGIETDPVCASTGVTTLCDAGSTGAANFAGPLRWVPRLTVRAGRVWWRRWPEG
jgi:predicted amidohydrolase